MAVARVHMYARAVEALLVRDKPMGISLKASLHSSAYVPETSHFLGSDLRAELSGGNYRPQNLQGREFLFDTATQRLQLRASAVKWPKLTGGPRYMTIRFSDDKGPNPALLCWIDLGETKPVFNATFSVGFGNDIVFEVAGVVTDG